MTRRRPGRRPARPVEAARREERGPAAPSHYGDVERRLAEEVIYLHSLWRSGPPTPDLHPGGGSLATHVRADRRKRRRLERRAEPEDTGPDWPLAPSPPASQSPGPWPDASTSSPTQHPPPPQPSPASLAQRAALRAAEEFFSGHASDDDVDEEGSESEDAGDAAAGFFLGLFERDAELRGYYERSYEEGEFVCMGCAGRKARRGKVRRFRDCIGLVRHAHAATRCGRPRAHRALASTVCRVLGWDIDRLPSIVIDPRGTLGQALLAREGESAAAASAHEAKENVDSREDGNEDAAKEDVGSGKNSSSSCKEDADTEMNDGPLSVSDGVAAKEDNNDIDQLSSKDTPTELCKAVQEEDADSEMNDVPLSDGVAAKEDADTKKSGAPSNGNHTEVHEQENATESAEKEDTNDKNQLYPKDATKELCKVVQEEEVAIDNKQEHAKSADDMGGTCNVSLESSSPKEEAARENKEEHTNNAVRTGDNDIGNLGNSLMDSSKVYSGTHDIWTSRTEILD